MEHQNFTDEGLHDPTVNSEIVAANRKLETALSLVGPGQTVNLRLKDGQTLTLKGSTINFRRGTMAVVCFRFEGRTFFFAQDQKSLGEIVDFQETYPRDRKQIFSRLATQLQ